MGVNYDLISQERISGGQGQKKRSNSNQYKGAYTKRWKMFHQEPLLLPNQDNATKMIVEINDLRNVAEADLQSSMDLETWFQGPKLQGLAIKTTLAKWKLDLQGLKEH